MAYYEDGSGFVSPPRNFDQLGQRTRMAEPRRTSSTAGTSNNWLESLGDKRDKINTLGKLYFILGHQGAP